MKTVFHLKDKPDYYQHFGNPDNLIEWVYRYETKVLISDEAHKLFTQYLNFN